MQIKLLDGATATNSQPTLVIDGFTLERAAGIDEAVLLVASTAGSGTMDVTIRLWGYSNVTGIWHPLGTGSDVGKGVTNAGAIIGETSADQIAHSETVVAVKHLDRIYAEITAINGTATAIDCWIVSRD